MNTPQTARLSRRMVNRALLGMPLLFVSLVSGADSVTANEGAARNTAQNLINSAHGALANAGLSEGQKLAGVERAVRRHFAFRTWERFLLGDNAGRFSGSQLSTFRGLLPRYLAKLYFNQFGRGLRGKPEIVGARTVRGDVLVQARVPRSRGGTLGVDYRIRGGQVIDFMVGGTSFLVLKRAEFNATINRGGPDALNAFLQNFIAR